MTNEIPRRDSRRPSLPASYTPDQPAHIASHIASHDDQKQDIYILVTGIQSLTAAVHLIQEAGVAPTRIHIFETTPVAALITDSQGDAENGYDLRAGLPPQFHGPSMDHLLSLVPSIDDPNRTVKDDILDHANELNLNPQQVRTRFLKRYSDGSGLQEARGSAPCARDRFELLRLGSKSEKTLGLDRICDHLSPGFAESDYWMEIATAFGFKPTHSAAEFRRFVAHFTINDLTAPHPLDLGKYNMHESITVPILRFLERSGVDFQCNTTVCDVVFAKDNPDDPTEPTSVTGLTTAPAGEEQTTRFDPRSDLQRTIELKEDDVVFFSFGSVHSSMLAGSNDQAPIPPPHCWDGRAAANTIPTDAAKLAFLSITTETDQSWYMWLWFFVKHHPSDSVYKFGHGQRFCSFMNKSRCERFTITLSSSSFLDRLVSLLAKCENQNATNKKTKTAQPNISPLTVALTDHPWCMCLRVPPQPVFPDQPPNIWICHGTGATPECTGEHIRKPMLHCSGQEIFEEILAFLQFPFELHEHAKTVPVIQPRTMSTLLPREPRDRPCINLPGMKNAAAMGLFVDIRDEPVVGPEYCVRSAQIAVRDLVGVPGQPRRGSGFELLTRLSGLGWIGEKNRIDKEREMNKEKEKYKNKELEKTLKKKAKEVEKGFEKDKDKENEKSKMSGGLAKLRVSVRSLGGRRGSGQS